MNMPMNEPLTPLSWERAFTTWRFAPITLVVLLAALLLLSRRGGRGTPPG